MGDHQPEGWTDTGEAYFVDSSGLGRDDEPALTWAQQGDTMTATKTTTDGKVQYRTKPKAKRKTTRRKPKAADNSYLSAMIGVVVMALRSTMGRLPRRGFRHRASGPVGVPLCGVHRPDYRVAPDAGRTDGNRHRHRVGRLRGGAMVAPPIFT